MFERNFHIIEDEDGYDLWVTDSNDVDTHYGTFTTREEARNHYDGLFITRKKS